MSTVAIVPVTSRRGKTTYHAHSGDKQSRGATPGKALDALTVQLRDDEAGTLVVIQHQRPDAFFGEEKQRRMADLMARWRSARDSGSGLAEEEQAELDALIKEEIQASAKRTAALLSRATE